MVPLPSHHGFSLFFDEIMDRDMLLVFEPISWLPAPSPVPKKVENCGAIWLKMARRAGLYFYVEFPDWLPAVGGDHFPQGKNHRQAGGGKYNMMRILPAVAISLKREIPTAITHSGDRGSRNRRRTAAFFFSQSAI